MNKVCLVGRLTKTPELKQVGNDNLPYTQFTVAINRTYKDQSGNYPADFIQCVAWRGQAENLCKYMNKGSQIGVEGTIQTRTYQNNDGKTVYITEVLAERIQFLESKGQSNNNSNNNYQSNNMNNNSTNNDTSTNSYNDITEDDLPF